MFNFSYNLNDILRSFPRFIGFVFQKFPIAYLSIILMCLGVVLEYATLSIMIPLSSSDENISESALAIIEIWKSIIIPFGFLDEEKTWLWLFLLFLELRVFIGLLQLILNTLISKQIHKRLSSSTFFHVIAHVPMHEIYKRTVGHYMALAGDDSIRVGQLYFSLIQAISSLFAALIGLLVLYLFSQTVFLFTIVFLLICAIFLAFLSRNIIKLSAESALVSREVVTAFVEALNGLRSIRSMGGEEYVSGRYSNAVLRYTRILFLIDVYNHSSRTLPGLFLLLLALFFLFPTAQFFDVISIVYFFTIITMLVRVLSFLGVTVFSLARSAVDMRAVLDLEHILVTSTSFDSISNNLKRPVHSIDNIQMQKISYEYKKETPVLHAITGSFRKGKSYALIGKSGSGKSTLSDILLGMLTPSTGLLEINGVNFKEIDIQSLRQRLILVEQETKIFSSTLRENITFGLIATDDEVDFAVHISGLSEFIQTLPLGLNTQLDYQGSNISGGQRQRIGLARAIIRNPDVLILDEATSALDAETRNKIIENLKSLFHHKILLFITHDSYVIKQADHVWHLKKGKLNIEK